MSLLLFWLVATMLCVSLMIHCMCRCLWCGAWVSCSLTHCHDDVISSVVTGWQFHFFFFALWFSVACFWKFYSFFVVTFLHRSYAFYTNLKTAWYMCVMNVFSLTTSKKLQKGILSSINCLKYFINNITYHKYHGISIW